MVRRPAQTGGARGPRSLLSCMLNFVLAVMVFDTKVGHTFAQDTTPQAAGCLATGTNNVGVSSITEASMLSLQLLECAGAEFVVDWQAVVAIDRPFQVSNGTSLILKGSSAANVIDGANEVQLFVVNGTGSSLSLENVELKQGQAFEGGAIRASHATVTLVDCAFVDNGASSRGGVV